MYMRIKLEDFPISAETFLCSVKLLNKYSYRCFHHHFCLQELSNSQELLTIKDLECRKLETTLQENIKQLSEKEVSFNCCTYS